jgi:ribosomal protein S18 acetylase RimI-like enzyme
MPAQPSDGSAIRDIILCSGNFGTTDADCVEGMFAETWKALAQDPDADTYHWLVCRHNQRVAGFACFGTESLTHNTWDLFWVCVRPENRGQGIGQKLLQTALAQAASKGARLMVIYTSSTAHYAAARALYESQSFARTAVVPDYYADGDDLFIYSRKVACS